MGGEGAASRLAVLRREKEGRAREKKSCHRGDSYRFLHLGDHKLLACAEEKGSKRGSALAGVREVAGQRAVL